MAADTSDQIPWVDDDGQKLGFVSVDAEGRIVITYAPTTFVHIAGYVRAEDADRMRQLALNARRCPATYGEHDYRCTRDVGHVGAHRRGAVTWGGDDLLTRATEHAEHAASHLAAGRTEAARGALAAAETDRECSRLNDDDE